MLLNIYQFQLTFNLINTTTKSMKMRELEPWLYAGRMPVLFKHHNFKSNQNPKSVKLKAFATLN